VGGHEDSPRGRGHRAGPLSMYSATMVCRTDQNKVAEGLLLGE